MVGGGGGEGGFKVLLQLANFTLGPDATLNTELIKNSVRIKALNSVNASKRKHENRINHYDKQRCQTFFMLGERYILNSAMYSSNR